VTQGKSKKLVALLVLGVMLTGTCGGLGISPAQAGTKAKRNLAIGLAAVTAYGLLKKNNKIAIPAALGTAYYYKRYRDARQDEELREERNRFRRRLRAERNYYERSDYRRVRDGRNWNRYERSRYRRVRAERKNRGRYRRAYRYR
jgi:hypothetical protein